MYPIFNAAFKIFNWFWNLPITFGSFSIYVYQVIIFILVGGILINIIRRIT